MSSHISNQDRAAALHTLSLMRALLDRYERALTVVGDIPSRSAGSEPMYRRALQQSYVSLGQAFGAELAGLIPTG